MNQILILDYGMGNLNSVKRRLTRLGIQAQVSGRPEDVFNAGKLILPGVGHFAKAVSNLKNSGLWKALNEAVLVQKKPILGICLGMQLMAAYSEEGNAEGLGWFDAEVVRFRINDSRFKVPHMGWNTLIPARESILLSEEARISEFYFVHSYHWQTSVETDILTRTEYGYPFVSAVEKNHIHGVQFHPEKSHAAGGEMLMNFCR